MKMSGEMMPHKAPQAPKISESQLPIVLSALEAKANGQTIEDLKDIAIKMFGTYRNRPDPSETFMMAEPNVVTETEEGAPSDDPDEDGGRYRNRTGG